MITFLTDNWKELTAFGVILVVFIILVNNYLKQSTSQQKTITDINTKIFDLFTKEIKVIAENTSENKKLNKDISVIQAQIQKQIIEHDSYNRQSWEKMLQGFDRLCDFLNGNNPRIAAIQKEIRELKKVLEDKI